jgi:hypothetical protein
MNLPGASAYHSPIFIKWYNPFPTTIFTHHPIFLSTRSTYPPVTSFPLGSATLPFLPLCVSSYSPVTSSTPGPDTLLLIPLSQVQLFSSASCFHIPSTMFLHYSTATTLKKKYYLVNYYFWKICEQMCLCGRNKLTDRKCVTYFTLYIQNNSLSQRK